jgi:hypothetical protein
MSSIYKLDKTMYDYTSHDREEDLEIWDLINNGIVSESINQLNEEIYP